MERETLKEAVQSVLSEILFSPSSSQAERQQIHSLGIDYLADSFVNELEEEVTTLMGVTGTIIVSALLTGYLVGIKVASGVKKDENTERSGSKDEA